MHQAGDQLFIVRPQSNQFKIDHRSRIVADSYFFLLDFVVGMNDLYDVFARRKYSPIIAINIAAHIVVDSFDLNERIVYGRVAVGVLDNTFNSFMNLQT